MQQHIVLHFTQIKNDRVYQLMIQPGTPYQELKEVLDLFKADFDELQKSAEKQIEAQGSSVEDAPQSE